MNCSADLVKKSLAEVDLMCDLQRFAQETSLKQTSSRLEPTLWLLRLAYDGKQMAQFKSNKIVSVGILSISEGFGTN